MTTVHSEAIGHFIRETEILDLKIRSFEGRSSRDVYVLCTQRRVSNEYFLDLISDFYFVLRWPWGVIFMKLLNRVSSKQHEFFETMIHRPTSCLQVTHSRASEIIKEHRFEEIKKHLLQRHSEISPKLVVLAIRDLGYDEYLNGESDLSSQSYRITPLANFKKTLEYLHADGYSLIRVGRHNSSDISQVFSSAQEIRNIDCSIPDLCDFSVFDRSDFVISTGTGVEDIGLLMRKPIIYVNIAPFGDLPKSPLVRGILATDYFDSDNTRLSLSQIRKKNFHMIHPKILLEKYGVYLRPKNEEIIHNFVRLVLTCSRKRSVQEISKIAEAKGIGQSWKGIVY